MERLAKDGESRKIEYKDGNFESLGGTQNP